MFKLRLHRI